MIISNYFRYFCVIFMIFPNYADAQNSPNRCICKESGMSSAKANVVLIPESDPRHPSSLCKIAMHDDIAQWYDVYFATPPKDVCTRKVRCSITGKPLITLAESPMEGVECVLQDAVNDGLYRLGCLNGACVPFENYPVICEI